MDKLQDGFRGFIVPVDIFEVPELDWKEQMVYIVLRSYANARESTAFPSMATIAKNGRMSESSAKRAVSSLVEKGLLKKEIRLKVTKNRKITNNSNLYTIETPKPEKRQTRGFTQTGGQSDRGSDRTPPGVTENPTGGQSDLRTNIIERIPMNNKDINLIKKDEPLESFPFYNWLEPEKN